MSCCCCFAYTLLFFIHVSSRTITETCLHITKNWFTTIDCYWLLLFNTCILNSWLLHCTTTLLCMYINQNSSVCTGMHTYLLHLPLLFVPLHIMLNYCFVHIYRIVFVITKRGSSFPLREYETLPNFHQIFFFTDSVHLSTNLLRSRLLASSNLRRTTQQLCSSHATVCHLAVYFPIVFHYGLHMLFSIILFIVNDFGDVANSISHLCTETS